MYSNADAVVEREFTVGARPQLSVTNISGRVEVRGREGSTIKVRATKHGPSGAMANTQIELSSSGDRVRLQTKGEKGGLLNLVRNVASVDYEIDVPPGCEVQVEGVSADVEVTGLDSRENRLQTVSGDVKIEKVSGEYRIVTVSGDASARHVTGTLTLRTTSGDAQIFDSQLQHFNLNSVSGDFAVETPLVNGQHYLAKTVSGDLVLRLPEGVGATVQMKSVSGNVQSELPADVIKAGRRHWQGRINGGGAAVEMNSVSGDLRIVRAGGGSGAPVRIPSTPSVEERNPVNFVPPTPPVPPVPPVFPGSEREQEPVQPAPGSDDTNAILKALEQGEITVEEAMQRLDALR